MEAETTIRTRPAGTRVRVRFHGELIAETVDALVMEEGNYAPVYYLPRRDVKMERLIRTSHTSFCPHKGHATYYSISNGGQIERNAVWSYETPLEPLAVIKSRLAFYPDRVSIEIGAAGGE